MMESSKKAQTQVKDLTNSLMVILVSFQLFNQMSPRVHFSKIVLRITVVYNYVIMSIHFRKCFRKSVEAMHEASVTRINLHN